MRAHFLPTLLLPLALAAACTATPTGPAGSLPGSTATAPAATPGRTATPPAATTVRLWLPAPFDPAAQTPAGALLRQRLEAFQQRYPGVQLEVRLKDETGQAGMLASLTAAHEAAPRALPDVLLLPAEEVNAAALKGLLTPLDGEPLGAEAYDYAASAVRLEETRYGVPLGAEATIFAYRKEAFQEAPVSWTTLLSGEVPFLIAGGSPRAEFVLALYLAQGGLQEGEHIRQRAPGFLPASQQH